MLRTTALVLILMAATAAVLHLMGQPFWCPCGTFSLWHGLITSNQASQQLTDWYTLSHIVHGLLFWLGLSALNRRANLQLSVSTLLIAAVGIEAAWEILENSPLIIQRYRQIALGLGYTGDSILNSLSDIAAMVVGFLIASRLSTARIWLLILALELLAGLTVRDNLTLNIIMLIYPSPAINHWQAGTAY